MVTIGVDAHKQQHMAVALDDAGRELGRWQGPNNADGWSGMLVWAEGLGEERVWGIEGAWNYGRGLSQHLVGAGERVYEVNPRWTAQERRKARKPDKSDPLDARAVAQYVLRKDAALPVVVAEDETVVLDLLVTEREGATAEATRLRNQIHQLLLQLDPEYKSHLPDLKSNAGLDALLAYTAPEGSSVVRQQRAASVRRLAERLKLATQQAEELAKQISSLAGERFSPLTRLTGVQLLTAGALAGILGPCTDRFATEAQFAAYAGVAPLEASSAGKVRHRLNRGGNRRLNSILYRIAVTQSRSSPEAKGYIQRRISEGKTAREALRALKRYIARAIWRLWRECYVGGSAVTETLAA